jgi:hypothetical protein
MRFLAVPLSVLGMASGVLLALVPWTSSAPDKSFLFYTLPAAFGVALVIANWFTLRQSRASSFKRAMLIALNAILIALTVTGFLYMTGTNPGADGIVLWRVLILEAAFVVPLVSNVLYLCIPSHSVKTGAHGS